MTTDIRKISVGRDYPNGAIHYQVGKVIKLQFIPYTVQAIRVNKELKELGKDSYDIYLSNKDGTRLWKTVTDMPVVVENNIAFE